VICRCLRADSLPHTWRSVCTTSGCAEGGLTVSIRQSGSTRTLTASSDIPAIQGTPGFSNIENRAEYQVEHQSVGISSGGSVANGLLVGMNSSGSSTKKAAVSKVTIVIRDPATQQLTLPGSCSRAGRQTS